MKKNNVLLFVMFFCGLSLLTSCNDNDLVDGNCDVPFMAKLNASVAAEGGATSFNVKKNESFFCVDYVTTIQGTDTVRYSINVESQDVATTPQNISKDWFNIVTKLDEETKRLSLVNVELEPNQDTEERILLINVLWMNCSNTLTITQAAQSE
ncbi:MAG: hypothetical protein ACK5M7_15515 [Draconibacterium sp.]